LIETANAFWALDASAIKFASEELSHQGVLNMLFAYSMRVWILRR